MSFIFYGIIASLCSRITFWAPFIRNHSSGCAHITWMFKGTFWMLYPGVTARIDSDLKQLVSTARCICMPTLWSWYIVLSLRASLTKLLLLQGGWDKSFSSRCLCTVPGTTGLQFQLVPLGATTIQTIINHWPTPSRLSVKPNTIKVSPGAKSTRLCKRFSSESGGNPLSWDI